MLIVFSKAVEKFPEMPVVKLFEKVLPREIPPEYVPTDDAIKSMKDLASRFKTRYPICITIDNSPWFIIASVLDKHSRFVSPHNCYLGVKNDVICFFSGKFSNTNDLVETYGLKDVTNGANIVIDIYGKTQPQDIKNWHSALANFQGEYSFVLYDPKTLQFFASTDPVGTAVQMFWGTDSQENIIFSNNCYIAASCSQVYYGPVCGGYFVTNGQGIRSLQTPEGEQTRVNPAAVPKDFQPFP